MKPKATTKSPDPTDVRVGTRIHMRRNALAMSQTALADHLGITFQQVQKYEKGVNRVGAGRLAAIAEALSIDVGYFYQDPADDGTGKKHSPRDVDLLTRMLCTGSGAALAAAFLAIEAAQRRAVLQVAEAFAAAAPAAVKKAA